MADEERQDTPQEEPTPEAAEEPTAEQAEPEQPEEAPEQPEAAAEPEATEQPEAEAAEQPEATEAEAAEQAEKPKPKRDRKKAKSDEPDVIPGAHLEPDLVLEDSAREEDVPGYVGAEADEDVVAPVAESGDDQDAEDEAPQPLNAVLDLAADARYRATGKRKSAVARVTLKPGTGKYTVNGKSLEEYFPRPTLQTQARRPLETVGQ